MTGNIQTNDSEPALNSFESDMSTSTPDTEYSPPVSPHQLSRDLKDARSLAKKKLALLSTEEKVRAPFSGCASTLPCHNAANQYLSDLSSYRRRLLENQGHSR